MPSDHKLRKMKEEYRKKRNKIRRETSRESQELADKGKYGKATARVLGKGLIDIEKSRWEERRDPAIRAYKKKLRAKKAKEAGKRLMKGK